MPDTFLGLSILILLLVPGVVFVIQADNRRPNRDLSALRELVSVAAVGAVCDFTVLVLFGIFRTIFPKETPNVGDIARIGFSYARLHLVTEGWWIAGLLTSSCLLAFLLGIFWPGVAGRVASGKISFDSSWWELFHQNTGARIYVGCELQDDTYIAGFLWRYSTEPEETVDREIVLAAPVSHRSPGSTDASTLDNVAAVTIRASQMKYLTVTYMAPESLSASSAQGSA